MHESLGPQGAGTGSWTRGCSGIKNRDITGAKAMKAKGRRKGLLSVAGREDT